MKPLLSAFAIVGTLLISACGMVGPGVEEVRNQPAKTVYRSADESAAEASPVVLPKQKVPGE